MAKKMSARKSGAMCATAAAVLSGFFQWKKQENELASKQSTQKSNRLPSRTEAEMKEAKEANDRLIEERRKIMRHLGDVDLLRSPVLDPEVSRMYI